MKNKYYLIIESLEKARPVKYVRRFKGKDGKWKYVYADKKEIKKKKKGKEKNIKPIKTNNIDSIINKPDGTPVQIEIAHFSNEKIEKFSVEKGKGGVYFLEKPTSFPDKSFDFNDYVEKYEKEKQKDLDMTDEEYAEWKDDPGYVGIEEQIASDGWYYGDYANITSINTSPEKILDLRGSGKNNFDRIGWLQKNIDDFKNLDEDETIDLIENFYDTTSKITNDWLEININKTAKKRGYDVVLYDDNSEGNPYTSVVVVNDSIIGRTK